MCSMLVFLLRGTIFRNLELRDLFVELRLCWAGAYLRVGSENVGQRLVRLALFGTIHW
jgi:hypothetical protein